jgi:hypothetical protein
MEMVAIERGIVKAQSERLWAERLAARSVVAVR